MATGRVTRDSAAGIVSGNRNYLFFDTETTGLPRDWKAPLDDLDNWPRLVQLAYILFNPEGKELRQRNVIVRPSDFSIPVRASEIHGISTEKARVEGRELREVLREFSEAAARARFLVAHNIDFDEKVIGAEYRRTGITSPLTGKIRICTMKGSRDFCGLYGSRGKKYPTLSQLHVRLFGTTFSGAHDAAADIRATARCFWELRKQRVL